MSRVYIETTEEHKDLLGYIVAWRKLREPTSNKSLIGEIIVAYAKAISTGMPEEVWRKNIINLINKAEEAENVRQSHRRDVARQNATRQKSI